MTPRALPWAFALLLGAGVAMFATALFVGSVPLGAGEVWRALWQPGEGAVVTVVRDLRLPRALTAFAVGGMLALSGALLQALLRNPLADPYVLGISGGAAVAALAAMAAGASLAVVQGASMAGAFVALALLFVLARRALFRSEALHAEQATAGLLLIGVMIAALAAAGLSLLLALAPDGQLRSMMFWLVGDLGGATERGAAGLALALLVVLAVVATTQARALDLLVRGDVQAATQGVDVPRVRRRLVVIAALATGTAVTLGGAVGFVGFAAPHVMRLWLGNEQRVVLPASVLGGGMLVLMADTAARTVVAPQQLPVGVLTALLGAPLFLWLLVRR
jgi:iron complex transport system permease protein